MVIARAWEAADVLLRLGRRQFGERERVVMAVINRTPDSFFDRGATYDLSAAVDRASAAVEEGAAIIDIGGVKAGPGDAVDAAEELRRVVPVVAAVRERHPDVVISVDTWRAVVAREVGAAGCDLVNDAWGGVDPDIFAAAAEHGAGIVCTHAGHLPPRTRPHRIAYDDVVADVVATVTDLADRAVAAGVPADQVLIDPGHDFGKNSRHSLEVTRRLGELVGTGWPVLVSLSRKDFVGETLDLGVEDRLEGTLAATAVCTWLGARVFRAHDVTATVRVLRMVEAIAGDRDVAVARRGLA
jgi:dihydropteroate synthase